MGRRKKNKREKSLTELFRDCKVTFSGRKSPRWNDDVTFHPPDHGAASSAPAQQQQRKQEKKQQEEAKTCRGRFWRNQNRDHGQYTLVEEGEEEGGGEAAQLRLAWDRWDEEVLVLKEKTNSKLFFQGGCWLGLLVQPESDVVCYVCVVGVCRYLWARGGRREAGGGQGRVLWAACTLM